MLILTILKAFAWIWGVAVVLVFIIDMVDLVGLLREGHKVNVRRYLLGTLKSLPMAPFVYICIISGIISSINMIVEWYRKYSSDSE